MPIFEYHCPDCRESFEELRSVADRDKAAECPKCRRRRPTRKVSLFAASGLDSGTGSSCSSASGFS